ncbi:MAG: ester cyclase [Candidatus Dormiibacterota bacterium]
MPEHNKVLARRNIEEVWNQGKIAVVDELIAHSAIFHDPNLPEGKFAEPEGYKKYVSIYRSAFPDLHLTIHDQVAEGDKVVTRWSASGTNDGPLMGIAATHKRATVLGVDINRYENGKIVEGWISYDMLGLLQQLGVETLEAVAAPA